MSVPEIVDAFTGWGFSISNEQVAHPTTDFVMCIYCACLEQVTGITPSTLQPCVDSALELAQIKVRESCRTLHAHDCRPRTSISRHYPTTCSFIICAYSYGQTLELRALRQCFANAARFHDFHREGHLCS